MATKKNNSTKKTTEEPMLNKIAGTIGQIAGEIVVAKNTVMEKAGGAIDTVKATIQNFTGSKKPTAKKVVKAAVKKTIKKAMPVKKAVKKTVKKAAPAKKAVKVAVKKAVKKVTPAKKAIKKVAKKAVKKISRKR